MTPAPEKAAPIPADVLALARKAIMAEVRPEVRWQYADGRCDHFAVVQAIARAILQDRADREARPSLPDSREEQIREDERDRLYEKAAAETTDKTAMGKKAFCAAVWLSIQDAMHPADRARARQGGNNG